LADDTRRTTLGDAAVNDDGDGDDGDDGDDDDDDGRRKRL
jgi:hypothetical protein